MSTQVFHVFGTMDVGGAELRTLELDAELRPLGVEFSYVTLSGRAGQLDHRVDELGGSVFPVPLDWMFPFGFLRLCMRRRPDVVHSHVATFSGLVLFLAWVARTPVRIAHFRSDSDGRADSIRRRTQRMAMRRLIGRFATSIVGVSPGALTYGYRPHWERDQRARVIPNGLPPLSHTEGVDLRERIGSAPDLVLMHVGRPHEVKNRPLAVEVLRAVRDSGINAVLVLVGGSGEDETALTELIAATSMSPYIAHVGAVSNPRDYMAGADLILVTSRREGLPGVVLESLSVGTPVVSTELPGAEFIAAQLPGVVIVERGAPLDAWVGEIVSVGARWQPEDLRQAFRDGPFTIAASVKAHLALYGAR